MSFYIAQGERFSDDDDGDAAADRLPALSTDPSFCIAQGESFSDDEGASGGDGASVQGQSITW